MDKLLSLLLQNARLSNRELGVMLDMSEKEVEEKIEHYQKSGIIYGYRAILNYEKIDKGLVVAFIELKVTPKPNHGFDDIAKSITYFTEVDSVYLMSGGYDLSVVVKGKSFKDIAMFVSTRLAALESVVSTKTNFVLSRYKIGGVITYSKDTDERGLYFRD